MTYSFGSFDLDSEKFELRDKGKRVPLEPQVFLLLDFLIKNRSRMVSKVEIIDVIWGGQAVSDASVSSRIKSARRAVSDDGRAQHTIRTIHGQGFRFVADITEKSLKGAVTAQVLPESKTLHQPVKNEKPSIAILPFQSLGIHVLNNTLADAIPHELIQALSRLRWLLVIARGSAFRFRKPDPDVQEISKALNVRYVLAGSLETLGSSQTIMVELSDSRSNEVIWGDRYTVTLENIHEIRTQIVAQIVSSLEVHIPLNEARNARLGVSENLDAWSIYHLGLQHMYRFTQNDNAKATMLFDRAARLDPGFARAHAGLSFTSFQDAFLKYSDTPGEAILSARRHAERSIEIDALDPFSNLTMGRSLWLHGDLESSIDWLDRAINLNPNYAHGHYSHALTNVIFGRPDKAHLHIDKACLLSPLDPLAYGMFGTRALSCVVEGDYENAAKWANKAARAPGAHFLIAMVAVLAYSLNQDPKNARLWAENARGRRPDANQTQFFEAFPFLNIELKHKISSALTLNGL